MPTTIITDPGTVVTTFGSSQVEVSSTTPYAGAGWSVVPFLFVDELELACNAYGKAVLHYELGRVLQPGDTAYHSYTPLAIRGQYVRVTIGSLVWIGYVPIVELERDGVFTDPADGIVKFKGHQQKITAVGLEYFLDRNQIDTAVVHNANRITRALAFNGGTNHDLDSQAGVRGNRNAIVDSNGFYDFTLDQTAGQIWTAGQIVKHLLAYQWPADSGGLASPSVFRLSATDDAAGILESFAPTIATERQTVFKLFNQIMSPQRGLVWWAESTDAGVHTDIRVASAAVNNITMPGGATFPANANQVNVDFDNEVDVIRADIKAHGSRIYHRVICRGERMTGTGTIGYGDATISPDWTSPMETEYDFASAGDADYGVAPGKIGLRKSKDRNDAMRKADRYAGVFSHFIIPNNWNGKTGDGGGGHAVDWLCADLDASGNVIGGLAINPAGMRLLQKTRLKEGWDYSNPQTPVSKTPAGSLTPFAAPFAVFKVETSPDKYQLVEHMGKSKFHAGGTPVSPKIKTSYHLKMQPTKPGIVVQAQGALNHTCAKTHFAGTIGGVGEPSNHKAEVQFESLRVTVTIEVDKYCEGVYYPNPPAAGPIETLVVDVGEHYRLDFLAKNTMIAVNNGDLVLASTAAVLRDDRKALQDLARIAYEWYAIDRQQIELEYHQLRPLFNLGQLVTTVGSGTVSTVLNTVISSIKYDVAAGTTTVKTADDTLDVRSLAGEKRKA